MSSTNEQREISDSCDSKKAQDQLHRRKSDVMKGIARAELEIKAGRILSQDQAKLLLEKWLN